MTVLPHVDVVQRDISAKLQIEAAHGSNINFGIWWPDLAPLTGSYHQLVVRATHDDPVELLDVSTSSGHFTFFQYSTTNDSTKLLVPYAVVDTMPAGTWAFHWRILVGTEYRELAHGPFIVHPRLY